jgi:trehalose 6-phosphate synthase
MNLVCKEYVAAQDADDPGVLVLSRFAGAAAELDAALLVNPYDPESVSAAIARAFAMPRDERVARHKQLMDALLKNDIATWGERFLDALTAGGEAMKTPEREASSKIPATAHLRVGSLRGHAPAINNPG